LAYFDERAALSATNTSKFNRHLEEAFGDPEGWAKVLDKVGRDLSPEALMSWWREERKKMLDAYIALDPKTRLPWYGLPMSALSSATARLMETWAHGQDVFDALRLKLGLHNPSKCQFLYNDGMIMPISVKFPTIFL
jgi:uncharacterized protein (TIGR03084 family)